MANSGSKSASEARLGRSSERAAGLHQVIAAALAVAAALAPAHSTAQARSESPAGAASAAGRITDETSRPSRLEENIQHGFFGDLSRPAAPAFNRIEGIRIPAAASPEPAKGESPDAKPALPSASPSAPDATLATEPASTPGANTRQAGQPGSVAASGLAESKAGNSNEAVTPSGQAPRPPAERR